MNVKKINQIQQGKKIILQNSKTGLIHSKAVLNGKEN